MNNEKMCSWIAPVIRTICSAVGGPFGGFATFWSEFEQKKLENNITILIATLQSNIKAYEKYINNLKNDIVKLKNTEIVLAKIVQHLSTEWEELKIKYYANIALNCCYSPESLDKKIQVIDQFSRLSLKDIELLQQFGKGKNTLAQICFGHYEGNYIYSLIPSIAKLSSYWLIEETFNETAGFNVIPRESHWEDKCYILTPYGKSLLILIKPIK